jgi:hypothetical protein
LGHRKRVKKQGITPHFDKSGWTDLAGPVKVRHGESHWLELFLAFRWRIHTINRRDCFGRMATFLT